jgi:hypothetical protein
MDKFGGGDGFPNEHRFPRRFALDPETAVLTDGEFEFEAFSKRKEERRLFA